RWRRWRTRRSAPWTASASSPCATSTSPTRAASSACTRAPGCCRWAATRRWRSWKTAAPKNKHRIGLQRLPGKRWQLSKQETARRRRRSVLYLRFLFLVTREAVAVHLGVQRALGDLQLARGQGEVSLARPDGALDQ